MVVKYFVFFYVSVLLEKCVIFDWLVTLKNHVYILCTWGQSLLNPEVQKIEKLYLLFEQESQFWPESQNFESAIHREQLISKFDSKFHH